MNCCKILTTSAFVLGMGNRSGKTIGSSEVSHLYHNARDHLKSAKKKKTKTSILDRHMEDDRHREHLQSEGIAEEKQKYGTIW